MKSLPHLALYRIITPGFFFLVLKQLIIAYLKQLIVQGSCSFITAEYSTYVTLIIILL